MHKFLTLANVSLNSLESQKYFFGKTQQRRQWRAKSNRVHSDIKIYGVFKDYDMLMCYASLTRLDL